LLKELLALTNELDEEKEICETAFIDFNQNHFSDWAKMFAGNLADKVDGVFYSLAGEFLLTFLVNEKKSIAQNLLRDQECLKN
jgi:TorA maturation chaperone TorD